MEIVLYVLAKYLVFIIMKNQILKIGIIVVRNDSKNVTNGYRPVAYRDLPDGKIQIYPFTRLFTKYKSICRSNKIKVKKICPLECVIIKGGSNRLRYTSKILFNQAQILEKKDLIRGKDGKIINYGQIDTRDYKIDLSKLYLAKRRNYPYNDRNYYMGKIFRHKTYKEYYLIVSPDIINTRKQHKIFNVIKVLIQGNEIIVEDKVETIDKNKLGKVCYEQFNDYEIEAIRQSLFVYGRSFISIKMKNVIKTINPQ